MKPSPPGWPRISSSLYYEDAHKAIDWLCEAFGFEVRLKVENAAGEIEHSELVFGDGLVMVGESRPGRLEKFPFMRAPREVGGANTQNMMVYVDDVEAHCKRARAAGAKITKEPETTDYGEDYWSDRSYGCEDIGGHNWWFSQRLRSPKSFVTADLDRTLVALADPTRRRVVDLLRKRPRRAGELADALDASPPAMSRHLRVLRQSGLVAEDHDGEDARVRVYRLQQEPFRALRRWIEDVEAFWTAELDAFKQYAERTRGRAKR